jgi:uncharacterized protein
MTDDLNPAPLQEEPPAPAAEPSTLTTVFLGPNGIRAGWRLLIFLAIVFAASSGFQLLLIHFLGRPPQGGDTTPGLLIIGEAGSFLTIAIATAIMSKIEKRSFAQFGLPLRRAFGKLFWQGYLWGLAQASLLMLAIAALGGYSFGSLAMHSTELLRYGVVWAIGFLLVGFFEEFAFRGYMQFTLGTGIGFWGAATVLSALFGALHLLNPGEGAVGAASIFMAGMFWCLTLRRTGSLWFAVGLHAAFDWGESFLYSVPDSGTHVVGHLSNSTLQGPRWLTGGTVGPEGSVFVFILMALGFLVFHLLYPSRPVNVTVNERNSSY